MNSSLWFLILIPAFVYIYSRDQKIKRAHHLKVCLPPGPKSLPIVGNLFDIPTLFQWITWSEWGKQYGEILHFTLFGSHSIILDSIEAVTELFEKRSSIYSDRPRMPMVKELIGWDWTLTTLEYGSVWRKHRRAFHEAFHDANIPLFLEAQRQETRKFLQRLLDSPREFRSHIKHLTGATILRVVYGLPVDNPDDPYMSIINEAMESVVATAIPGAFLVDIFPILKYVPSWMPGAQFKVKAARWRKVVTKALNGPFDEVKSRLASTDARECVLTKLLGELEKEGVNTAEDEEVAKNTAGVAFLAGADTTSSALAIFFAAMALHPEVQRKAQSELECVVGAGRLPEFTHKLHLPYLQAVIKEVLRWQVVIPLGFPRKVTEDNEYAGYRITGGSTVFGNAWSILHNEKYYFAPHTFDPERFFDKGGELNHAILDPERVAFGFGRRVCPGREFALNSLFIAVASILCAFNIDLGTDTAGTSIAFEIKMSPGLVSYPEEFPCTITPRSQMSSILLQQLLVSKEMP